MQMLKSGSESREKQDFKGKAMKRLCWHDWDKWGETFEDYDGSRYQYRECKKCGKIIRRIAFWNNSITSMQINESVKDNP